MADTTHADGTPLGNGLGDTLEKRSPRVGRRKMLLGAAAAGVGAGVVAGAEPAGAASPDVLLGKKNTATATTTVSTTKGNGLEGETSADSDAGLYGVDISSGGGAGVQGTSKHGTGVLGSVTGDTTGQRAVYGIDQTSGGGGYGVVGTSTDGTGVYGSSSASPPGGPVPIGSGVYGLATAEEGLGVFGYATGEAGVGVLGMASGEDVAGVYAEAEGSGSVALSVQGNADVTGTLTKGGGSFKIDHPVDPENKYLYHSFVESPDMKNIYDGTVILDGDGRATVELPDWFEALNRDYRYQLTAIGGPAPELHISREVKDRTFSIAGGKRDQKVSWQVTGIRQDAWANANRIQVEVDKKAEDRGRYLHPELFGGEAITALTRARGRGRKGSHVTEV
jgi:hypothetical protein